MDIQLFDPIAIPTITVLNGTEKLAALQGGNNKQVSVDLIKSYIKPYKDYSAQLGQTASPVFSIRTRTLIDEITNGLATSDPNYLAIILSRIGVGNFDVKVRYNIANTNIDLTKTLVLFSDNRCRVINSNTGADGTSNYIQFIFNTYDTSWNVADGVLNYLSMITVKIY